MNLCVIVIDRSLGVRRYVEEMLCGLPHVREATHFKQPRDLLQTELTPDVVILGPDYLSEARSIRKHFPNSYIIGRLPFMQEGNYEFHPWGDELRDPTVALTSLVPQLRSEGA